MTDSARTWERIAKLVTLLSSDQDGEVVAAARAIGRALAAGNLDWHDLAERLQQPPSTFASFMSDYSAYSRPRTKPEPQPEAETGAEPKAKKRRPRRREGDSLGECPTFQGSSLDEINKWIIEFDKIPGGRVVGTHSLYKVQILRKKLMSDNIESITEEEKKAFDVIAKELWSWRRQKSSVNY